MKFNAVIAIAVVCIAAIEVVALFLGHDGALISMAFTAIGGLIGAAVKVAIDKAKQKSIEAKECLKTKS